MLCYVMLYYIILCGIFNFLFYLLANYYNYLLSIGDWGLGIGDWGLGPIPNPQSPIPNPQSPI